MSQRPPGVLKANALPYRKLQQGRDYWIKDNMLPNALEIAERCFAKPKAEWALGAPWYKETWPGMRSPGALLPEEVAVIETWVKQQLSVQTLWQENSPDYGSLSHNYVQLVGGSDSGPRPHTDSRKLCRVAAVLYLSPNPLPRGGTSFYRLRMPNGALGGNICPPPHANLREALGVSGLPLAAWKEDMSIENRFNRLLLYRADIVHSASSYFGVEHRTKRMTAVFFWMTS